MTKNFKQDELQNLQERYSEMNEFLLEEIAANNRLNEELRYYMAYISNNGLEDDFIYFRTYAHEEYREDMPFPFLTL